MKIPLNFLLGKNMHLSKMATRRRRGVRKWSRDRLLRGGVAVKDFKGPDKQCCSRIIHLAKLNPNCHMNYSIIFTEISFSPETST